MYSKSDGPRWNSSVKSIPRISGNGPGGKCPCLGNVSRISGIVLGNNRFIGTLEFYLSAVTTLELVQLPQRSSTGPPCRDTFWSYYSLFMATCLTSCCWSLLLLLFSRLEDRRRCCPDISTTEVVVCRLRKLYFVQSAAVQFSL